MAVHKRDSLRADLDYKTEELRGRNAKASSETTLSVRREKPYPPALEKPIGNVSLNY